jgi:chromosome segregation ATPase
MFLSRLQRELFELKKERDRLVTDTDAYAAQLADALAEASAHEDRVTTLEQALQDHPARPAQADHAQCVAALSAQRNALEATLARTHATELEEANAALSMTRKALSEGQEALAELTKQRNAATIRAHELSDSLQEANRAQRTAADDRSELRAQLDALRAECGAYAAALAVAQDAAASEHAMRIDARRRLEELEAAAHTDLDMTDAEPVPDQAEDLAQLIDGFANLVVRRPFGV